MSIPLNLPQAPLMVPTAPGQIYEELRKLYQAIHALNDSITSLETPPEIISEALVADTSIVVSIGNKQYKLLAVEI